MRLFVVAIAVLIGWAVPDFGVLFALMASAFFPFMQCFMPLGFSFLIRKSMGQMSSPCFRQALHIAMGGVAAFTLTVGFWQSLQAAIQTAGHAER